MSRVGPAEPRIGTARDHSRATLGAGVAEVAARLKTPFMPWQRHVADVAYEIDNDTGELAYSEVVLTVPRQSGKTTLILPVAVHRCVAVTDGIWRDGAQNVTYTAQTRNDARQKWVDDHVVALQASVFKRSFQVRLANGSEAIQWKNGSKHKIGAATKKSGHGSTLDLAFIDEAFSQVDARQEQALLPAMNTRESHQMWVVSTAGTIESTYLRKKVDDGRRRIQLGQKSRTAYFEWSAEDSEDIYDPEVWWRTMPALGHTITEQTVRDAIDRMDADEFARAYLNQWRVGLAIVQAIPAADWNAAGDETAAGAIAANDPYFLGLDISPDRSWSSVAVAGKTSDGRKGIEVIEHAQGTDWVMSYLKGRKSRRIALDPAGPAGSFITDLEDAGFEVTLVRTPDITKACGALYDDAKEIVLVGGGVAKRRLAHRNQPWLNTALAGASKRILNDAWAWDRKTSQVVISPLVAATVASYARAAEPDPVKYDPLLSIF